MILKTQLETVYQNLPYIATTLIYFILGPVEKSKSLKDPKRKKN